MAYSQMSDSIRSTYGDCCLTHEYAEPNCRIDVSGLEDANLAAIHGDRNQSCQRHRVSSHLCDRLVFGQLGQDFVCSIEMKGGKNPEVSTAIRQIQGGLDLAKSILDNRVVGKWYPLLFYSGKIKSNEYHILQTKKVSYSGKPKTVDRLDCGSSLLTYLNKQ